MKNRSTKFILNSGLSLVQQLVTVVCGLILPQMILATFGSAVNGTMSSITQFLSFITLLQGGVGTVARIALYKPLADKDNNAISVAYKTISNFFQKFSLVFLIYLIGLSVLYPLFVNSGFDYWYVFFLVLILGLASVFEYFFGQASQLLLYSDQKGYIYSLIQIVCVILSTIIGVLLVNIGCSIHVIKLVSALIFAVRPIVLFFVVHKHYKINRRVNPDKSLMSQRKAALVRHIAFYIHTSTDIVVLTIFSNVLWVSVYTVHKYVVSSLSNLVSSVLGNTEVVFGDMIAKNEKDKMKEQVPVYDILSKAFSSICFFTCIILISKFVAIYTRNVTDIDYYQPIFAILLVLSEMIYCMGITYQNIYIAAGHIKQTQWIAVVEAAINIVLSVALVWNFGIIGVAFGTVVAMTFKTVANIYYMKKYVFDMSVFYIIKSYAVNIVPCIFITWLFWTILYFPLDNYLLFFGYAAIVFVAVAVTVITFNLLFFRKEMNGVFVILKHKFLKK